MFILARGGQTYSRLRFNVGPGGSLEIPVNVDYSRPFPGSNEEGWNQEYLANVAPDMANSLSDEFARFDLPDDSGFPAYPNEPWDEFWPDDQPEPEVFFHDA
jgi:hypothetical protein